MSGRHRAVFLDRDGVINRDTADFIKTAEEFEILSGVTEAVAKLNALGFLVIVITNQSGIARGLFTEGDLAAINAKLLGSVARAGGTVTGIYHCPHGPDDSCNCRKPMPGMVLQAAREHGIDLGESFLVGDLPRDIECGVNAGCRTILVLSGQTSVYDADAFQVAPEHVCDDLGAAAEWIEVNSQQHHHLHE